jgi:hypothetical protein
MPTAKKAKQTKKKKLPLPLTPEMIAAYFASLPTLQQRASAIVGHVMVHFGAGYGAQRQSETPNTAPANAQIFQNPSDARSFHLLLLDSVIRNFNTINWDLNPGTRNNVLRAAFDHGVLARQRVVQDGTTTLTFAQIMSTLRQIQTSHCPNPGAAGGGDVCDF